MTRRTRSLLGAVTASAGFVLLGALVVESAIVHRLDQWSVANLMPGLARDSSGLTFLSGATVDVGGREHSAVRLLARAVMEPAAAWPSSVLVVLLALVFWARGARRSAVLALGSFAAVAGLELVLKGVLTRPPLYLSTNVGVYHVAGFDSSYPSGHASRALLLSLLAAWAWPRLGRYLALWVTAVAVLLVLGGFHTPTDVAGGLLLASAVGACLAGRFLDEGSASRAAAPPRGAAAQCSVVERPRRERVS